MNLIGLTGLPNSGKDTVAEIIQLLHPNFGYKLMSFAKPLKVIVATLMGVEPELFENREFKESISSRKWWYFKNMGRTELPLNLDRIPYYSSVLEDYHTMGIEPAIITGMDLITPTNRQVLQDVADLLKTRYPNLFSQWMKEYIYSSGKNLIITDVRYNDEAEVIKMFDGIIIEVRRDEAKASLHSSDKGISQNYVSYVIKNNGSKEELENKVRDIISDMLSKRK